MYSIDSKLIITALNGTYTPIQQALIEYQRYRDEHPLPDDWSERYLAFSGDDERVFCYLESRDFILELEFNDFAVNSVSDNVQNKVAWVSAHIFRKDNGLSSIYEATGLILLLIGCHVVLPEDTFWYKPIVGNIDARPFNIAHGYDLVLQP